MATPNTQSATPIQQAGRSSRGAPHGTRALTEYGEIMQDIARTPRRSLLTWVQLKLAGHA